MSRRMTAEEADQRIDEDKQGWNDDPCESGWDDRTDQEPAPGNKS